MNDKRNIDIKLCTDDGLSRRNVSELFCSAEEDFKQRIVFEDWGILEITFKSFCKSVKVGD